MAATPITTVRKPAPEEGHGAAMYMGQAIQEQVKQVRFTRPIRCPRCKGAACDEDAEDVSKCGSCGVPGYLEISGPDEDDRGTKRFEVALG